MASGPREWLYCSVELNKRTKIAGGVLALALAALGFDRFGTGPQGAEAAETPEASPASTAPRPPVAEQPSAKGRLAGRLAELGQEDADASVGRDAFVAPAAWFVKVEPALAAEPVTEPGPVKHRLTAVMGADFAKVDDHLLRIGKAAAYDGEDKKSHQYELVSVRRDESGAPVATVRIDGVEFTLGISGGERAPRSADAKAAGR